MTKPSLKKQRKLERNYWQLHTTFRQPRSNLGKRRSTQARHNVASALGDLHLLPRNAMVPAATVLASMRSNGDKTNNKKGGGNRASIQDFARAHIANLALQKDRRMATVLASMRSRPTSSPKRPPPIVRQQGIRSSPNRDNSNLRRVISMFSSYDREDEQEAQKLQRALQKRLHRRGAQFAKRKKKRGREADTLLKFSLVNRPWE